MRSIAALFLALATIFSAPVQARGNVVVITEWVETRVETGADRFVASPAVQLPPAVASYGPFRVLDSARAALVDVTDSASPADFEAMLRDYPGIATLEMLECPGTANDVANMRLGRMIRAAGLETHVPRGGSVRSGAVELFLAGATRRIDEGAEFAVHSWLDSHGREADDFAADAPVNATYLDYYQEMGMEHERARAFYDMTNSVPHADALWLTAQDMRGWVEAPAKPAMAEQEAPQIAYFDIEGLGVPHLDGAFAFN